MGWTMHGCEYRVPALLQKGDESERTAIRAMTEEDAGCLYWTASALGKWAKLKGFTTLLKHKDTVKAYITRVGELNSPYFYAGPALLGRVLRCRAELCGRRCRKIRRTLR